MKDTDENEVMEQFREGAEGHRRAADTLDGLGHHGMAVEARRIADRAAFLVTLMESGLFREHPRSALLASELADQAGAFGAALDGLAGVN